MPYQQIKNRVKLWMVNTAIRAMAFGAASITFTGGFDSLCLLFVSLTLVLTIVEEIRQATEIVNLYRRIDDINERRAKTTERLFLMTQEVERLHQARRQLN